MLPPLATFRQLCLPIFTPRKALEFPLYGPLAVEVQNIDPTGSNATGRNPRGRFPWLGLLPQSGRRYPPVSAPCRGFQLHRHPHRSRPRASCHFPTPAPPGRPGRAGAGLKEDHLGQAGRFPPHAAVAIRPAYPIGKPRQTIIIRARATATGSGVAVGPPLAPPPNRFPKRSLTSKPIVFFLHTYPLGMYAQVRPSTPSRACRCPSTPTESLENTGKTPPWAYMTYMGVLTQPSGASVLFIPSDRP